jgi:hypothetical protein
MGIEVEAGTAFTTGVSSGTKRCGAQRPRRRRQPAEEDKG